MAKRKAVQKDQSNAATQRTSAGTRPGRGPVDAPGKKHRTPQPPERLDTRMGEPEGKKMGQKSSKTAGMRGVRR